MFKRKGHTAIDSQIKEAMLKPLTAENLNYISDLYLRKGERELAIECLYNSISKLHVSQRDKMIAIYKKIIKLAPGDERAYKGLIEIFAKMGLVAEEVRHLMLITKVYQGRGEYEKVNEVYRRVHLIDPGNETASKYFGKGKPAVPQEQDINEEDELNAVAALLSSHPEIGDLTGLVPGGETTPQKEAVLDDWDMPFAGADTSSDDPAVSAAAPSDALTGRDAWCPSPAASGSRSMKVYLFTGITVLLLLTIGAGTLVYKKVWSSRSSTLQNRQKQAVSHDAGEWRKEVAGITIAVTRVTVTGFAESGLDRVISPEVFAAHQFYTVTMQSAAGCLPEAVVRAPLQMISFIGEAAVETVPAKVAGVADLSRTVYKAIVQGCGENKAVFMKIIIAHPKGQQYRGIAVRIMEKGAAETITWD